jgi:aminopeptidase N
MFLFGDRSLTYLLYPQEWSLYKEGGSLNYNTIVYGSVTRTYEKPTCLGAFDFTIRSSAFGNGYDFATFAFTQKHRQKLWRLYLNTRVFIQYAVGRQLPEESSLYLAGASPEELIENKFTRAMGFFPESWTGYGVTTNHFHAGGGLNLRGYAGYLVAQEDQNGNIIPVYKGNSGFAINAELDLDRLVPLRPKFTREWLRWNIYLFGDAGILNYNQPDEKLRFADLRADAGIGTAFTIKKWGRLDKIKPFTIRFDVPLWLNRPPAAEQDYVKFRWVLGINRAF